MNSWKWKSEQSSRYFIKDKLLNNKLLAPKQMLQRLPITYAQVKAGNTSGNLLNKIRQIIYSFYRKKILLKKYTTT